MTTDGPIKTLCRLIDEGGLTVRFGLGAQGHIPTIEKHLSGGRPQQPGDDIEQGRLAASRGSQESVGLAVLPNVIHGFEGVVLG